VRARSQRNDDTGHGVGDVIARARCVVDAVAAASCSTTLERDNDY
jgi:hypothetical protein